MTVRIAKKLFTEIQIDDCIVMDIGKPQTVDDVRQYDGFAQVCFKEQPGRWYNYDGTLNVEISEEPIKDVDGDNLCEIRKSANEMIFILQNLLYGDKKRSRHEQAELHVLEKHAYWILSKTN